MASIHQECSLQQSATPNTAWTDNPIYWNRYERATLESHAGATLDTQAIVSSEPCLSCGEPFIAQVVGQSFCSMECYIPPCSVCHHELAFLDGDQPTTRGMPLCAGCYWEAEEEMRYQRAQAREQNHSNVVETPPPSPIAQYIWPGEPEYNGYNHELDDWQSDEEEDEDRRTIDRRNAY